jgi:hypothetical protein
MFCIFPKLLKAAFGLRDYQQAKLKDEINGGPINLIILTIFASLI